MKRHLLYFVALVLFLSISIDGQEVDKRAAEVIKKSKAATVKQGSEAKSWHLDYAGDYRPGKEKKSKGYVDSKYQANLWFEDSPKIRLRMLATYPNSQQELIERIFNNGDFSETNRVKIDDRGFKEMTLIPSGDLQKINAEKISKLKLGTFSMIFPILFKFDSSLKFTYAGVAKAGEQRADVLETSIDTQKIKLFFDKETHLLLLMTTTFYDDILKKDVEQKFFYSDFKEENGFRYAHKVIVQENGEVTEERLIKLLKPNPEIKSDHFNVKK